MPIQLPNLDDRTYDDLVEEARSLIPTYAPEWTNHNPSDPGITLIELFAYLTELLIYRLNRVTDANVVSFLKLLNGPGWQPSSDLAIDIQKTMQQLRQIDRAVTCEDFEQLALRADDRVARAECLPRRNLQMQDFETEQAGHVGVLIVPKTAFEAQLSGILATVQKDLEPRCLLTTHLHVAAAQYRKLQIATTVVPLPDVKDADLEQSVRQALKQFLAPLTTDDKPNWAFGRNVFVSEVYQLLDQFPGVDYVTQINMQADGSNRRSTTLAGAFVGIKIRPYELIANLIDADITVNIERPID
ncbi:baseplate J/gp47 family protein [Leptolyngbya sp. FACHB-321]|uniref:baseplate J/gp47 family protein n=1 Tax=Leptolyngbya sp. FACHB-321 TaxID=2692807 RepID=UPI0016840C9D|nr:baseplate J/gp47 family protein [Leptolyngbya sp. FACHB-321]MBD2037665.1 baseplate J/gp47 family protein [Leptolyngbya sp. FACHB-321]